jgi:hypothetical protein
METDNVLLVVAVVAVIVSLIGAGLTYSYITAFKTKMTGFAASGGWINLSVEQSVAINFTYNMINWSSGRVTAGQTYAELDTSNSTGSAVVNGNWTANTNGLVIENIGNRNVTIQLKAGSDAATMIGGTAGGGPLLRWKLQDNETDSCIFNDTTYYKDKWNTVNTSDQLICDYLDNLDGQDELKIHIYAKIPSDSITGDRGNTITATFAAA